MKKLYFSFLCMAVAVLLSSCAHSVYPLDFLYSNYNSRMRSPEDLAIKANVWIYFNEKDSRRVRHHFRQHLQSILPAAFPGNPRKKDEQAFSGASC